MKVNLGDIIGHSEVLFCFCDTGADLPHLFPFWSVIVNRDCGLTVSPMATANSSNILSSTFYLTGIPGYEEFHHWFIPFSTLLELWVTVLSYILSR